jgi:hypothetical protein
VTFDYKAFAAGLYVAFFTIGFIALCGVMVALGGGDAPSEPVFLAFLFGGAWALVLRWGLAAMVTHDSAELERRRRTR